MSAYKIGYLTAAADLLLALYGEQVRDVSSTRASYRYIHISGETSVCYGNLLLNPANLTGIGLARALQCRLPCVIREVYHSPFSITG